MIKTIQVYAVVSTVRGAAAPIAGADVVDVARAGGAQVGLLAVLVAIGGAVPRARIDDSDERDQHNQNNVHFGVHFRFVWKSKGDYKIFTKLQNKQSFAQGKIRCLRFAYNFPVQYLLAGVCAGSTNQGQARIIKKGPGALYDNRAEI
jgi:hypothetical protein